MQLILLEDAYRAVISQSILFAAYVAQDFRTSSPYQCVFNLTTFLSITWQKQFFRDTWITM